MNVNVNSSTGNQTDAQSTGDNNVSNKYIDSEFSTWDDVEINQRLLRGIYGYGFEKPSPIQGKSIVPFIQGGDIIAQAQSGTGKTGAFCISALERIETESETTQIVVVSPTHELARQSFTVCQSLGTYMKLKYKLLVGGTSSDIDRTDLTENVPHIVFGTPGRILDMMRKNALKVDHLKTVVIDEADEMFKSGPKQQMGFKQQLKDILMCIKGDTQIALFSATIPKEFEELTGKFMRNPTKILVRQDMITLEGINQFKVALDDDISKYECLKDLFSRISIGQCIIYCNSVNRVKDLADAMVQDQFPVCSIHSKMESDERKKIMEEFRQGKWRVLISSDVTARGIDVQTVSVVINFDIPRDVSTYLHRIGRSGRWGRKGTGINFVTRRDVSSINNIETYYSTEIVELLEEHFSKF